MTSVDEFDLAPERPPATPPSPRSPGVGRSFWAWVALGSTLVVAGAVAAPDHPLPIGVGLTQGPTAQILDVDLTSPPSTAWSVDIPMPPDPVMNTRLVDDTIVVMSEDVAAYDLATGQQRWSRAVPGDQCTLTTHVVCTASAGPASTVTTIDVESGNSTTRAIPNAVYAAAVGDLLVVATDVDEGHVTAFGAGTEPLWDTELDAAVIDEAVPSLWLTVAALDDVLVVGGPVTYAIDATTGAVQPHPGQWSIGTSSDGLLVVLDRRPENPQRYVVQSNGDVVTTPAPDDVTGSTIIVDDGGGTDVLLQNGPRFSAQLPDGTELWTAPEEALPEQQLTLAVARLDGVAMLITLGGSTWWTSGHDLVTGEELWSLSETAWSSAVVGSGSTVLRITGTGMLAGTDVHTGTNLWELDPGGYMGSLITDDGLVMLSDGTLTRMVWS